MSTFKPLLSATIDPMKDPQVFEKLKFPLLLSPKYDGVRVIVREGVCLSRTLKPIPNKYVQKCFGKYEHLDGELIAGNPRDYHNIYNRTQSAVMSRDGEPEVSLFAFDWVEEASKERAFVDRLKIVSRKVSDTDFEESLFVAPHYRVDSMEQLIDHEMAVLAMGYEGICLRDPMGPYKWGRSTFREHILLKLKRFADFEATIVDFVEANTNTNEATKDELGHTKRSSHKEGLVPANTLGKFIVEFNGERHEVPPGSLDHETRKVIWLNQSLYMGKFLKVRHFPLGAKDGLRLPRAVGFRDEIDL